MIVSGTNKVNWIETTKETKFVVLTQLTIFVLLI
jgi:hypothetical protein